MFEIIYQDEWLVAIHKPPHMLVHRSDLDRRDQHVVLQTLAEQLGQHLFPVHRLDRATSGLLMFALSADVARCLQNAFSKRAVRKTYIAIVRGHISDHGHIHHPLSDKRDKRREGVNVSGKHWPEKEATTTYQGLLSTEVPIACGRYPSSRYSLVALYPTTGRRHQLRRHMKHCNHPIVGDTTYGQGKHNRLFREHFDSHRLLLCATHLTLPHPMGSNVLNLSTQLDDDFLAVAMRLGWSSSELADASATAFATAPATAPATATTQRDS